MVQEMIQEAVKEQMIKELDRLRLKELGGAQETEFSQGTAGTSSSTGTTGTKPGIKTQAGNADPANNVMLPGTSMNVNQGLSSAAKEPNFQKKAKLIQKISDQIAGMKGVVIKESGEQGQDATQVALDITKAIDSIKMRHSQLAQSGMGDKEAAELMKTLTKLLLNIRTQLSKDGDVAKAKLAAKRIINKSSFATEVIPVSLGGYLDTSRIR